VPRPAMLVAMVTAPLRPAWAMISASFSWCLALRTTCLILARFNSSASISLDSMLTVPTRMGWPLALRSLISSTMAFTLPLAVE